MDDTLRACSPRTCPSRTQTRSSAESSIRPYIARDPEQALGVLFAWTTDPNPHVRRLVSEGTRLRLPWAPRVPWLDANPERMVALLDRLKDDASSMVRRSVANNLNDLGKAHPDLLLRTATAWLEHASSDRRKLIEHALRSAVKRGDPGALRLLGYGQTASVVIEDERIVPRRVAIGGRVSIAFALRSRSRASQDLLVDLAVHFREGQWPVDAQGVQAEAGYVAGAWPPGIHNVGFARGAHHAETTSGTPIQ